MFTTNSIGNHFSICLCFLFQWSLKNRGFVANPDWSSDYVPFFACLDFLSNIAAFPMLWIPTRILTRTMKRISEISCKNMDHQNPNKLKVWGRNEFYITSVPVFIWSRIPAHLVNFILSHREYLSLSTLVCLDWLMWCWAEANTNRLHC